MLGIQTEFSESSHVTSFAVTGCTDWVISPQTLERWGVFLTTQTHTLGFWATPISNCPRNQPLLGAAEVPPQEWKAGETASNGSHCWNRQQEKGNCLLSFQMLAQEGKEGLHFILFFKVAQNKTSKETLGVLLGCSEVCKNIAVAKIKKRNK